MDGKAIIAKARVGNGIVAEGDIGNGQVIKAVGEPGSLEGLRPYIRVRIKDFCYSGGEWVNLDAGDLATPVHFFRHQPDEMAYAAGGFEHASALKTETFQGGVHGANDGGRRIMRVECGGPRGR